MSLSVGNHLTGDDSNGTTQVLSLPTGGVANDLLIAAIFFGDNDATGVTAPSWASDVYNDGASGADRACAILTKLHAGGGESGPYTFTMSGPPGNARIGGIIGIIKGAKTSGWIDNVGSVGDEANTASPTGATAEATTTNNIEFLAYAAHTAGGAGSNAAPSGYTILGTAGDAFDIAGGNARLGLLYRINSTTGSKGGAVWTDLGDASTDDWTMCTAVIGEAVAAGGIAPHMVHHMKQMSNP